MSSKVVIQVISYIGQSKFNVQVENNLDYLIWEKLLKNLRIHGRVTQDQATSPGDANRSEERLLVRATRRR